MTTISWQEHCVEQIRNEVKKRTSEVVAESRIAIPSSSTEYRRLAEKLRIARVGGDSWNGMVAMGKVEEAMEDAQLGKSEKEGGRQPFSGGRGALAFFLPSETPPAEAARASPIDFYF